MRCDIKNNVIMDAIQCLASTYYLDTKAGAGTADVTIPPLNSIYNEMLCSVQYYFSQIARNALVSSFN